MEALTWTSEMGASALILALTFIAIFTEGLHGVHRAKLALGGAGAMVICGQLMGFFNPGLALEAIDWNVVFLLGAMMTIIAIMIPTGGFQNMAYTIADMSRGRLFLLLALMGSLITFISMLLDNVTTVVIFGPLIILICQALRVSPVPFLLSAAILSNTGGVATLVGDPPNLMIGSAAGIGFNSFVLHMGGIVVLAWAGTLLLMKPLFRQELAVSPARTDFVRREGVADPYTWGVALTILGGLIIGFILHDRLGWEPWFVAGIGLTLLVMFGRKVDLDEHFANVELTLLLFFLALFILVGGVEHSHFLEFIGQRIIPLVEHDLLLATILLMWVAAILSAMIDNIPFTAAMIPILISMEQRGINVTPLWWALSAGVGMGGNGTHLGATANVFVVTISEKLAKETGNHQLAITPGLWFRKGLPVMLASLIICSITMALFFDFFAKPL